MSHALLLIPDFLLILFGFLLCRWTALGRGVWDGVERLVYYVLFPVLLFNSIVKTPLQPGATIGLALGGWGVVACGIALAYALRLWPGVDARLHASGAQTAFRFNSFIALALAERLGGPQGVAWVALVDRAVRAAVQRGRGVAAGAPRRPRLPARDRSQPADPEHRGRPRSPTSPACTGPTRWPTALQRIGLAALPLGLMAVGAGLKFGGLKASPGLAAALLAIRHALLPAARPRPVRAARAAAGAAHASSWPSPRCPPPRAPMCWRCAWAATGPSSPGW